MWLMMTLVGGNVEREESLMWKQGREGVTKLDSVEERDAMEKKYGVEDVSCSDGWPEVKG